MSIEEEAKAVVLNYVAAFNSGDLDQLKSLLAESVPSGVRSRLES